MVSRAEGYLRISLTQRMARLPTLQHLRVELVWTPPWHAGLMSDKARQQLGWAD